MFPQNGAPPRSKTSSCWSPSLHCGELVYQRVAKPFFDFVKSVFGWMYLVLPVESGTKSSSQIDVDHGVGIGTLQGADHPVHIIDQYPENCGLEIRIIDSAVLHRRENPRPRGMEPVVHRLLAGRGEVIVAVNEDRRVVTQRGDESNEAIAQLCLFLAPLELIDVLRRRLACVERIQCAPDPAQIW